MIYPSYFLVSILNGVREERTDLPKPFVIRGLIYVSSKSGLGALLEFSFRSTCLASSAISHEKDPKYFFLLFVLQSVLINRAFSEYFGA